MKRNETWLNVFIFLFVLKTVDGFFNKNSTDNIYSYLDYSHVKFICNSRDNICKTNDTIVCAVRLVNEKFVYKNFENACYLFLSNLCDYHDNEFHIIEGNSCDKYLSSRRSIRKKNANDTSNYHFNSNSTSKQKTNITALREDTFKSLYTVDTAFDYHTCPLSCQDTYSPVCVTANRGFGKYFKYFTFVNHCLGDLYYCKNPDQFAPPPPPDGDEEDVSSSKLGWSYCGAYRYMQFNRFAEAISAMGHYGWLAGDYRYSHIMEPHERIPGYGK